MSCSFSMRLARRTTDREVSNSNPTTDSTRGKRHREVMDPSPSSRILHAPRKWSILQLRPIPSLSTLHTFAWAILFSFLSCLFIWSFLLHRNLSFGTLSNAARHTKISSPCWQSFLVVKNLMTASSCKSFKNHLMKFMCNVRTTQRDH